MATVGAGAAAATTVPVLAGGLAGGGLGYAFGAFAGGFLFAAGTIATGGALALAVGAGVAAGEELSAFDYPSDIGQDQSLDVLQYPSIASIDTTDYLI